MGQVAQKKKGMQLPHGANELGMIIDADMIIDACSYVYVQWDKALMDCVGESFDGVTENL